MRWKQVAVVQSLAAAALLFSTGCLIDWLVEDSAGRRITEIYTPYVIHCEVGSGGQKQLQVYTINKDGSLTPTGSRLNGEDCDESEKDPARPSTMSTPVTSSSSTSTNSNDRRQAGGNRAAHQDWYGPLSPLPGLPVFPDNTPAISTACTPGTSIHMVNHRSSMVTHIETCPLRVGKRINVGSNPLQLALTPDGRTVVVTRFDGQIVLIDTATDTVIDRIPTPGLHPNGIAISPDGRLVYAAHFDNVNSQVFAVDLRTRQIVSSVPTASFPKSVFLTPDGAQAWITHYQSATISIIDALTMTISSQVRVPGTADTGLAFNPPGTRAYIAVQRNALVVVDTATLDRVTTIPVEQWPTDVVFSPDGSRILVKSLLSNVISVVDARNNTLIRSAKINGAGGMGLMFFQ